MVFLISCKTSQIIVDDAKTSATYIPYSINFSAKNERFVSSYKLMRSTNNRTWTTIATFAPKNSPDSSIYSFQLAKSTIGYFYRVQQVCSNNVYNQYLTYIKTTVK